MNRVGATVIHIAAIVILFSVTASVVGGAEPAPSLPDFTQGSKIDKVFFAQHHVLEPTNALFRLVGGLPALIKVQVYADAPTPAPFVLATLELGSETMQLPLTGPEVLPKRPAGDPVLMVHSYHDSFTAMIPKDWVKTGLKVTVELKEYDYSNVDANDSVYTNCVDETNISTLDRLVLDSLKIGAPTKLVMQIFDIHYFGSGKGAEFPEGWETELGAKLPVAELVVHRVRNIMFNEIVMPPIYDKPSDLYTSLEDFRAKTGMEFEGEQAIALRWCAALKAAGGTFGLWRPYHINIAGLYSGGQAGGYRGCGNLHRHGVILHELGHTFGLPHWAGNKQYPYKRTMYGESAGEETKPNAGPTWAFDVGRHDFLAPSRIVDGKLVWTHDPMHGGGRSNMKNYMYAHFSDYSMNRMQSRFENQAAYWNEEIGEYAQWNQETGKYDKVIKNDGMLFPLERDAEVISLLASANVAVPDANIIYPPIGPYKAGLIRRFYADSPKDRAEAQAFGYTDATCNVCLRVTQGGQVKIYLMMAKISRDDDPMQTFNASAINLPARDGDITQAELLFTPDVIAKGITPEHTVLYTWQKTR